MNAPAPALYTRNWSFSSLMNFETCPMRFKLKQIDRLPELPRPPDNPMERGNRIHKRLELFVQGEGPMDHEARAIDAFLDALNDLRELYALGIAITEDDWLFNRDWEQCDKTSPWLWAKLDFCVQDKPRSTVIVGDYKSGKSAYKAVEHVQQLQLYAAVAALMYEWADTIIAELWYVDEGHVKQLEFTREEALRLVGRFQVRADKIYEEKLWKPNPNVMSCKYCAYGPRNGTGACPVGI